MNIKKMFTALSAMVVAVTMTMPSASVFAATYSEELQGAYDWAYAKWVTTMSSIDNANMYGAITRAEMAKMLSVYATEVLGYTADTSKACTFSDIDSVKGDLHDYIIESCQLGLMGQGITAFRPYDTISRAEFGTALSRTLWGNEYEGGTPYYAKHLDALKAAGIMNQIANAESTKEIRGYVMLMLQRSEENGAGVDCDDTDVVLACLEDLDNCPAACKADYEDEGETSDEVVKSGDLDVTISNASNSSIVDNGTADMDTIKFRASEEITISKVTLERYGYSTNADIANVRLEDEDGNVLTEPKSLNSKGVVTLSLKKDYKKVDGLLNATIVAKTTSAAGKTIGFKVTDVESSAKNLNLSNYNPFTYTVVVYNGATLVLSAKSTAKEYNYEAGESYEIAKFKVKAPTDWAVNVKGFTLTNAWNLDEEEWIDDVTVTVAGKNVDATYKVNKDKELVVTFKDEVELEAKANVEFVVNAELADDFDEYDTALNFYVKETSDFNATEVKTSSRVTVSWNGTPAGWPTYTFKWGKVKITNVKLGTVESPINSEDVVIAEGKIETTEAIKGNLYVTVKGLANGGFTGTAWAIEWIRVSVNGDETEGTPVMAANDTAADRTLVAGDYAGDIIYKFSNVEIDEDAKFQVLVDVRDDDNYSNKTIDFAFAGNGFKNMVYVENKNKNVDTAGSITIYKLNIQAAKASLSNSLSKSADYKVKEVNRHTVLNGTYTAKKGDVKLNEFYLVSNTPTTTTNFTTLANDVTFYLSIDGTEVADVALSTTSTTWTTYYFASDTFSDVEVEAGKSVNVVLEAEIDAKNTTGSLWRYNLYLKGEDTNGNEAGIANKLSVEMKVVTAGTVNVSAWNQKNTVLKRAADAKLATFDVKSSNSSEVDIDNVKFTIVWLERSTITSEDVTFTIGGVEVDATTTATAVLSGTTSKYDLTIEYEPTETVSSTAKTFEIALDDDIDAVGIITVLDLEINGKAFSNTFKKRFESALVTVESQEDKDWSTRFVLDVDAYDAEEVSNIKLYADYTTKLCATPVVLTKDSGWTGAYCLVYDGTSTVTDGDDIEVTNNYDGGNSYFITAIQYTVSNSDTVAANGLKTITKSDYNDYFKVWSESVKVFKNS